MSEYEPFPLEVGPSGDRIELILRRKEQRGGTRVLLIHGASAKSDTFLIPSGIDFDGWPRCLADWLYSQGYDPWLLDWRASGTVAAREMKGKLATNRDAFDLDHAARWDIPSALEQLLVTDPKPEGPIAAIGHCLGAAALAQAIAGAGRAGLFAPALSHVVLLTIGLYYELPYDSLVRNEDRTIERMLRTDLLAVDPEGALWPDPFQSLYQRTPRSLFTHGRRVDATLADKVCDRLSFMYGKPYLEHNLAPEIHHETTVIRFSEGSRKPVSGDRIRMGDASACLHSFTAASPDWMGRKASGRMNLIDVNGRIEAGQDLLVGSGRNRERIAKVVEVAPPRGPELPQQFGPIPLPTLAQGAMNARRRCAAPFGADRNDRSLLGANAHEAFERLERVTLVTGNENSLWHRRGIDQMYEWLRQGVAHTEQKYPRKLFPGYGHQDLLWGEHASRDVFEHIRSGLPKTRVPSSPLPLPSSDGPLFSQD